MTPPRRDTVISMVVEKRVLSLSKRSAGLFFLSALLLAAMAYLTSSGVVSQRNYLSNFASTIIPSSLLSAPLEPSIKTLTGALQEAVQVVVRNTGINPKFLKREQWKDTNSCKSRKGLNSLYHRLRSSARIPIQSNSQLEAVLHEYEILHRVCIKAAGNLTEYFYSQNTSTGCKFMIAEAKTGMGNKILLMTSAVIYAILTQRVILIPVSTSIPSVMCEPFLGSTWKLPDDLQDRSVGLWKQTEEFMKNVDKARAGSDSAAFYAARVDDNWQPVSRFFCETEQAYLTEVTWLSVTGSLYFLPKLFAIPTYQAVLEALFPDPSLALTQLLRTVMLPANTIWNGVKSVQDDILDREHAQVGVQVRYFGNQANEDQSKVVNSNVVGCILENRILQGPLSRERTTEYKKSRQRVTVFIASLTTGLHEKLTNTYIGNSTDDTIKVIQLTHEEEQRTGAEVYNRALLEVIRLSLSKTLMITPKSTFGGLAQAYGGITPWFIETRSESVVPCVLAQTSDVCYQIPDVDYKCPFEPRINTKHIMDFIPYIKRCLDIDVGHAGIQLVSRSNKNKTTYAR